MKLTAKEQDRLTIFTLAEVAATIAVEPLFEDGTKLVILHNPIRKTSTDQGKIRQPNDCLIFPCPCLTGNL
jgi:hypothetical protein